MVLFKDDYAVEFAGDEDADPESGQLDVSLIEDIALPEMNICIMIVGTHGDVLPFCGLGSKLQDLGHRVRIATHKIHRNVVMDRGFEFYPLEGDPKQLSKWCVESGGSLKGEFKDPSVIPEKKAMISDIIKSCLPAVTQPDPNDENSRPFVANAIISNPASYVHIHLCEGLAIPLHIMFPQPWYYGTADYPHPFMGKSFRNPTPKNVGTYAAFEYVNWTGLSPAIRSVRKKMGLRMVAIGSGAAQAVVRANIPFSAMWSPSFVPTPQDWPPQAKVVGTFTEKKSVTVFDETPFEDLLRWINAGSKPIFIGFGSMVIKDTTKLANMIKGAARSTQTRIIVQSGWSKIDVSEETTFCANVGPCPHDWLLPMTAGVIHHGGAGTTAAGLRHSLPSFICPFFGDQYMWGEMVYRAGVGPESCPVRILTEEILGINLLKLRDAEVQEKVQKMAKRMNEEDGIEGGLSHYLEYFPRHSLYCDVGILMGEYKLAKYKIQSKNIKLSIETAAIMKRDQEEAESSHRFYSTRESIVRNKVANYAVGNVNNTFEGLKAGFIGLCELTILSPFQLYIRPDKCARSSGAFGCLFGLIISPFYFLWRLTLALLYSIDRILTGINNGYGKRKRLFVIRLSSRLKENILSDTEEMEVELKAFGADGFSRIRQLQVLKVLTRARTANDVFNKCFPHYPNDHFHYEVVNTVDLKKQLTRIGDAFINKETAHGIRAELENYGKEVISFSQFCLIIHSQINETQSIRWSEATRSLKILRNRAPSMAQIYLANSSSDSDDDEVDDNVLVRIHQSESKNGDKIEIC